MLTVLLLQHLLLEGRWQHGLALISTGKHDSRLCRNVAFLGLMILQVRLVDLGLVVVHRVGQKLRMKSKVIRFFV